MYHFRYICLSLSVRLVKRFCCLSHLIQHAVVVYIVVINTLDTEHVQIYLNPTIVLNILIFDQHLSLFSSLSSSMYLSCSLSTSLSVPPHGLLFSAFSLALSLSTSHLGSTSTSYLSTCSSYEYESVDYCLF